MPSKDHDVTKLTLTIRNKPCPKTGEDRFYFTFEADLPESHWSNPYKTFEEAEQGARDFLEAGAARLLEAIFNGENE